MIHLTLSLLALFPSTAAQEQQAPEHVLEQPSAASNEAAANPGASQSEPDLATRVAEAREAALQWLIANQSEAGTWGSHHSPRPIEVLADIPGSHDAFRVATTGLALAALLESGDEREEVQRSVGRAVEALIQQHNVKRVDGLEHYNVWSFGYALQGLGELLQRQPDHPRADAVRKVCERLVEKCGDYQCLDGGWGYLSIMGVPTHPPSFTSMSFTTATILVGLARVKAAGIEVPEKLLSRALDSVARCETPRDVFTYGPLWNRNPASTINLEAGAACRTPACRLALDLNGFEVDRAQYLEDLKTLLVRKARFQVVSLRRPIPHESWYAVSGYFYLYGHAYAARVLDLLDDEARATFAPLLAEAVLLTRKPNGAFWDYPLYSYHDAYGTAYALIALARCSPEAVAQ